MKLTKTRIDAMTYEGDGQSRDVRWDDDQPGFGIRLYPSGRKAFVLSYRYQGRKRLMALGTYGHVTLVQARGTAKEVFADILKGKDPLEERKKESQGRTVGDLCAHYLVQHAASKKTGAEDKRRINRHILPRWRTWKTKAVQRADIERLHADIGETGPYEANRVIVLLCTMFNLAKQWGFIEEAASNPAANIKLNKEVKRDRWVTPEELPRVIEAINQEVSPQVRAILWLYLLTGVRKSELLKARWEDVDWERRELRLVSTKNGKTHYLPLNAQAMHVLGQVPQVAGNPYMFPGRVEGKHLVNINKSWKRVRRTAGIEDVRLHDLRRTVGSWLAQSGNSLHLIGRVLNHSDTKTTGIYARFGQDHVRHALDAHGEQVLDVAGKKNSADLINGSKPESG